MGERIKFGSLESLAGNEQRSTFPFSKLEFMLERYLSAYLMQFSPVQARVIQALMAWAKIPRFHLQGVPCPKSGWKSWPFLKRLCSAKRSMKSSFASSSSKCAQGQLQRQHTTRWAKSRFCRYLSQRDGNMKVSCWKTGRQIATS